MLNPDRIHDDTFGTDDGEWKPWDSSVMKTNVPRETIIENIRVNIQRQVPQHVPYPERPDHVAVVGGGPSLNDTIEELRDLWFRGTKIVALNGAAKWLVERNIKPSIQVVMDARENNAEFIIPIPGCKYFLASQTHPSVFEAARDFDTYIFHAMTDNSDIEEELLNAHYEKRWHPTPSCGTVGMVSILLMRELGFRFQHLFGMDSCFMGGKHHAYDQPINDQEGWGSFRCLDRVFRCSAAQAAQARKFLDIIKVHKDDLQLAVYGDGLLAYMLKTGAELKGVG